MKNVVLTLLVDSFRSRTGHHDVDTSCVPAVVGGHVVESSLLLLISVVTAAVCVTAACVTGKAC